MIIMAAAPATALSSGIQHLDSEDNTNLSSSRRDSLDEFKRLEREVQMSNYEEGHSSTSSTGPPNTAMALENGLSKAVADSIDAPAEGVEEQRQAEAKKVERNRDSASTKSLRGDLEEQLADAPSSDLLYTSYEKSQIMPNRQVTSLKEGETDSTSNNTSFDEEGGGVVIVDLKKLREEDETAQSLQAIQLTEEGAIEGGGGALAVNASSDTLSPGLEGAASPSAFQPTTPVLTVQEQNSQQFGNEEIPNEQEQGVALRPCSKGDGGACRSYSLASPAPSSTTSETTTTLEVKRRAGQKSASLVPETEQAKAKQQHAANGCKCESIKKDPKLKTKVCTIL